MELLGTGGASDGQSSWPRENLSLLTQWRSQNEAPQPLLQREGLSWAGRGAVRGQFGDRAGKRPGQQVVSRQCFGPVVHSYRYKRVTSIREVQRAEYQARFVTFVPFRPTLREQLPFRLEIAAHLATKSATHGCQEDGGREVARRRRQLRVGGIVELNWCRGERLSVELVV